jgi:hypothetical protein
MTHSWFRGLLAAVALTTAIGCGDKAGGSGSASAKAESTSKGATSGSAAAAASGAQSAKPEGSAVAKADAVDVKDILKGDGSGKSSNVLKVDLSKIDETAPALGGTPPKPPEPKRRAGRVAAGGVVLDHEPRLEEGAPGPPLRAHLPR